MPQSDTDKKPTTLDELESQLDKNALSPEVAAVERIDDDPPPPDPRAASSNPVAPRPPKDPQIDDQALEAAGEAAEVADDTEEDKSEPPKQGLHLEADPNAKRRPFWKRKRFWFSLIFLLILLGALAWFIRPSRLIIVNSLGMRVPVTVKTGTAPEAGQESAVLKNVTLTVNGEAVQSNDQGMLQATVMYGPTTIVAKKAGYEDVTHNAMLDFDPFFYALGGKKVDDEARNITLQLKAVGITLKFQAKDWLSDSPLSAGTFSVGDIVAKPNDQGQVQIVMPATDAKQLKVKAVFGGSYIDKEFDVALDGSQPIITFVPAGKDYFISNRSGGRGVYSSNLDGSEVAEVIAPHDRETSALNFTASPSGKYGVLASTRDNKRDSQGVLLQQVYVVDLTTNKMTSVDSGQWVNFVDWLGDTLVYTVGERQQGASAVTQRLSSVNVSTAKQTTLSNASSYGAIRLALDSAIYQVNYASTDPEVGSKTPELRVVPVKGGTEKNLGFQVPQLAQTGSDVFAYRKADGSWSEYNFNNGQNKSTSVPANPDRAFIASTSSDGQNRLVVGTLDGKTVLIRRNVASGQEKTLYSHADIAGPVRFVGNVVVFRQGSADYALSLNGGEPKKITSVTIPSKSFVPPPGYFTFY